jgi:Xaa-Pro aminopeptidase
LVDLVWADEEKPSMPCEPVYRLHDIYSGQSATSKYEEIAKKLPEGCNMMLVSTLDDIAWILNLRGSDINFNPIFFSYLILHRNGDYIRCDLFINKEKVQQPEIMEYLESINVTVYDYSQVDDKLVEYAKANPGSKISVDKSNLTYKYFHLLKENKYEVESQKDLIPLMKAKKNAV